MDKRTKHDIFAFLHVEAAFDLTLIYLYKVLGVYLEIIGFKFWVCLEWRNGCFMQNVHFGKHDWMFS